MNKHILKPEWIPSAYTESAKEVKQNLPDKDGLKLRLLKYSPKTGPHRHKQKTGLLFK